MYNVVRYEEQFFWLSEVFDKVKFVIVYLRVLVEE